MHRARGFFVKALLPFFAFVAGLPAARAAPVTSLYVVMVPGADLTAAAQDAMRVELVRLTGARDAVSDPTLAALIDNARQYVQLERTTTTGQVQVLFDEAALSAAIDAAGRRLWGSDRPLLWIQLPAQDPATLSALRLRLSAAAEERGLPITIAAPASPAPSVAPPTSASAPAHEVALDAARGAGAGAALVAEPSPSQPGTLQWTLTAPDASGQWVGGPELAIDNATDVLASAARALDRAPVAQFDCQIGGVTDLTSLVNVLTAVRGATGVTQVAVSDVEGDQLTLRLQARGSGEQLQRALSSERLQPLGTSANGLLQYRYVAAAP